MRKHRTLSLASAGGRPAIHDDHLPLRPSAAMTYLRTRNSRLLLISSVLFILSICLTAAQAAPAVNSRVAGSRSGSRTPLSRCPGIFNPASMTTTATKTSQSRTTESSCRYFLKQQFGTLTTPGFPSAFPVPFICSWIIDATGFEPDSFITLYLTQMYLRRGVKAVQYSFRNETHAVGRKELDELHTLRPRPYSVYRIKARYLEVQVNLHELVNANLRVERRLMDVYGFNITYEIQPNGSRIRSDTCNAVNCTFNGHCYANQDYSQFQCSCLPEFSGKYCQFGPECNPEKGINVCKNGGTCGYRTGLTVVRCSCPPNYNGSLCEFRREVIPAKECLSRFRLNCSHQCVVTDKGGAACRCPLDQALRSDLLTCYPLVPLRVMGHVEIDRPSSLNDTRLVDGVTALLRKMTDDYTASLFAVSSVHLAQPNSNVLQFVLWSSEKFNMSWTNPAQDPTAAALKSKGSSSKNRSLNAAMDSSKGRMPRYVAPFTSMTIPQQWNNSYTSFVNQVNSKTWRVMGETILIRNFSTIQVPALLIEWVKLDVKGQVREGYPFTVACNANGSKKLKLGWYKDGHRVDAAFALLRNMSIFVHEVQDLRGYFTLYLEVKQASVADRGEYECRASDWEQTVRKNVFLDVITPPILDLMPINPAVLPATAVNLTCRDENHLARRSTTKYVWLKNGQPIESSCEEIIEDLTPVGSLLKITSIQHSANYTCRGENGSTPANKTTHIFVVQPELACPQQKSRGIEWPVTAVEATNYQFCPSGYVGVARRRCKLVEQFTEGETTAAKRSVLWSWDEPDFAHCSDRIVSDLHRQMKLIALGYVVTDVQSIFNKFGDSIKRKVKITDENRLNLNRTLPDQTPFPYLPGEGNALLEMAKNLEIFIWKKTHLMPPSFWEPTAVNYLYALDSLLSMPPDFFRPDSGVSILRLIQNHLAMLAMNPAGGYPIGAIESHMLKNSHIESVSKRRELKYKRMLPSLLSQTGFKTLKQLAPAQFVFNSDGFNVTMDFQTTQQALPGGEYLCALLHLQPTNYSRGWDMDSCSVERLSNPSAFRCHCSHQGTVALVYVERDSIEIADGVINLWIVVYFATATSHLMLIAGLTVLSARWYRRRTIWGWFQIQLNVSLLPSSSVYFLQGKQVASDPLWTILLTVMSYVFVTTVWAMIMLLKTNMEQPNEQKREQMLSQGNAKLLGLSLGVPLTLAGIQTLLEEISTGSPFISWLSQISSISGIFFCFTYGVLVIVILVLYAFSTPKLSPFDKENAFSHRGSEANNHLRYNLCCLCLAVLSLFSTTTMLVHLHLLSLSAHCVAALLHSLSVVLWSALMFTFSGSGYICAFWCFWMHRNKLPGGDTVSEMLNATAMIESPQRKSLLSPEQHPSNVNGDTMVNESHRARKSSHCSVDEGATPISRTKRVNRLGPASSPLLQRAGLGPDVLRAFGLEESSERLQVPTDEPTDLVGRERVNSATMSEGMLRDDLDSGFGPSGGGGSQKLNGLDKFSDALKLLSRIRWKLPQLGFPSNGSTGGSFRSRQSTMSSATTAEFGVEQGSSNATTEETDLPTQVSEDVESLMAHYRLRRSRTRWTEDYGQENELDSSEVSNLTLMCKPYRGRCYIRCSPEKIGSNALWSRRDTLDGQKRQSPPQSNCCERCWHNPETPFCDLCLMDNPDAIEHPSGIISVRAVIENPPQLPDQETGEYLEMDPAGSLAVDQQRAKRLEVYYNLRPTSVSSNCETVTTEFNQNNRDKLSSITSSKPSSISPFLSHKKNILSGRIVKKYRISLRKVVHSTQQQLRQRLPSESDWVGHPEEHLSLRDQTSVSGIQDAAYVHLHTQLPSV